MRDISVKGSLLSYQAARAKGGAAPPGGPADPRVPTAGTTATATVTDTDTDASGPKPERTEATGYIDLKVVDANEQAGGDQAFRSVGQLRSYWADDHAYVGGNTTDATPGAELVTVLRPLPLQARDFLLQRLPSPSLLQRYDRSYQVTVRSIDATSG